MHRSINESTSYAFAKTAETITGTIIETEPTFSNWDKSTGITIVSS